MILNTRYKCPICGKITTGRRPRSFDKDVGVFWYPRIHRQASGEACRGSYIEAEIVLLAE